MINYSRVFDNHYVKSELQFHLIDAYKGKIDSSGLYTSFPDDIFPLEEAYIAYWRGTEKDTGAVVLSNNARLDFWTVEQLRTVGLSELQERIINRIVDSGLLHTIMIAILEDTPTILIIAICSEPF